MNRRGFLQGLGLALAFPAVIRTPGLLMPVRAVPIVVTPAMVKSELLLAIERGISAGVLAAEYGGRRIHFASMWDMVGLRVLISAAEGVA